MRIVKLTAENIKRLRAVEITPEGNTIVISGRNGQGKTSVLDAIWFALGGAKAQRGTTQPIRHGELHASVTLDLGDIQVTRSWTDDRSTLRVESATGVEYRTPQALLDGLVGRLSFDPLTFAQADARTQLQLLLEVIALPFDPAELAEERRQVYDERTARGREVRTLEGHLKELPTPPKGLQLTEVATADVLRSYRKARDQVTANSSVRDQLARLQDERDRARDELERLELECHDLEEQVARLVDPDVTTFEAQLEYADQVNRAVHDAKEWKRVDRDLGIARARHNDLTKRIAQLDKIKEDGVRNAQMPIEGLGFTDDGVTYHGVPFKQCAASEQLRVSLAMAMAMNPTVRVIRITDGSLLDSANMALIAQLADTYDYQVWIERVDESGTVGIVIEDGSVRE